VTEYRFPGWRRIAFVALLIVILVIILAPPISQGTVNVRIYGSPPQGVVSHVFVKFSQVELHTAGVPIESGWVTLTQTVPRIDLVSLPGQFVPNTLLSSKIQSGRYDSIRLSIANSTVVITNTLGTPVSTRLVIAANATIPVPPNGNGDVLVVLGLDYTLLASSPPSLSARIIQVAAL
jgi:hypothetical protein